MKPISYALLFLAALGYGLYGKYTADKAALAAAYASQNEFQKSVSKENATFDRLSKEAAHAAQRMPALVNYLSQWSGVMLKYTRINEETEELRDPHHYNIQLILNQIAPLAAGSPPRNASPDYAVEQRVYEFSGDYAPTVKYLGAFEARFELMRIQQFVFTKKGDRTVCRLGFLLPKFDLIKAMEDHP